MATPVINDIFRVVLRWTAITGIAPVNVMHISCPTGGVTDVAAGVEAAFQTSQFDEVSANFAIEALGVTPLDGVTAELIVPITPVSGGASGNILWEEAMLVSLHSTQRGPRGRGRLYIGPTTEAQVDAGKFGTSPIASQTGIWDAFANALIANSPTMALGIASYVHADWHQATSVHCEVDVATQVRRLRRQR